MAIEPPLTTNTSVQQARKKLFFIGLFWLAVIALIPLDPFVLYLLWKWFAVVAGFHSLSYGYAFGLFLLFRFIISPGPPVTFPRETKGDGKNWVDNSEEALRTMAKAYAGRLFTVGAGLVIHLFLLHG